MAFNFKTIWEGLKIYAKAVSTSNSVGDMEVLSTNNKLHYHNGSSSSPVVTEAHTATLTNKTLNGASIVDPARADVKKDTEANLNVYATTASNGQLVFATDTKLLYQIIDGALEPFSAGGGGGDVNSGANVGAGEGVFKQKSGTTLQFKSLTAGSGINLSSNTDEVEISTTGEANTASNVGTGVGVFKQKTGTDLEFKKLTAGSNIVINPVGDDIQISASLSSAGDVGGPSSSTDNAIVRFDGTTGKVIQNSSLTISDSGTITTSGNVGMSAGSSLLLYGANGVNIGQYLTFYSSGTPSTFGSNQTVSWQSPVLLLTRSDLVSINTINNTFRPPTSGAILIMVNTTPNTIYLVHNSPSVPNFGIRCPGNVNYALQSQRSVMLVYGSSSWHLVLG